MPEVRYVFFTALQLEANVIKDAMRKAGFAERVVYTIGLGASRLNGLPPLAENSTIVLAGLGGGLDPALHIGDLVFDGPPQIHMPNGVRRGRIFTSLNIVQTVAQKTSLFETAGAVAVDMEQSIVAAWAADHGHTVIGLRAISDRASDGLDPILMTLVDDVGRPRPWAIAKSLLRRPSLIVELLRLGRRSKVALHNLAAAAVAIMNEQNHRD